MLAFCQNSNIFLIVDKAIRKKEDLCTAFESEDCAHILDDTLTIANNGEDELIP